jgi:phenylacetate-CoA ligase
MVRALLKKAYGNGVVFANLHGQHRVPYLPEQELRALRDVRLRRMVRYAAATVPYYRRLFRSHNIDPRDIRSAEDLDRLPLVDKQTVRKDPDLFVSTSWRGRKSIPFLTSGSTGIPLKVYHDPYSLLANIAFAERERAVLTRICGRAFGYKEAHIFYVGSIAEKVRDLYRQWTFIPVRPERLSLSVLESVEDIVTVINRFRPDVIISYGSYLETLFKLLNLRGLRMHLPRVLIYASDAMTDDGRSFIEEKFAVPVLSKYSAAEAFRIGFFCEERRAFHLHEDLCHVKIVNARGEKVTSGEKGEVVISNLINRGTVLLNYRLGDLAVMSRERCSCGRTLPLLADLEGRVEDTIFLPDGEFVHPRAVWGVFKQKPEVMRYQLIQQTPQHFELRLVTIDRAAYAAVLEDILTELRQLLGKTIRIESAHYTKLDPPQTGKFRSVIALPRGGVSHVMTEPPEVRR